MLLPWDLEDWLTFTGDEVVRAMASKETVRLRPEQQLLYEVWLFDTEQRNGGAAQYFGNHGIEQWEQLCNLAGPVLPVFKPFASKVSRVVRGSKDPYEAVLAVQDALDDAYERCQEDLVRQLKGYVESQ